ncbi:septation protein SepH [Tessaracoccus sp.]
MNSALSPREIQSRLRAGASVPEVAAEAGVDVDKISGFALPVMAERAHMTRTALASSVRRRGDGSGHRRLGEIIHERLQARGLDADTVEWDAWRQSDLRWRVVGLLDDQAASRGAEFIFDPKGRFSIADNGDARWMIGEELPGPRSDPDNENTIDFRDELALVRAVSENSSFVTTATIRPGDDVPPLESSYEQSTHTSELDELYDMLSGVSEDSVRIYLELDDSDADQSATPEDDAGNNSMPGTSNVDRPGDAMEPESRLADALSEHPELPSTASVHSPENALGAESDALPVSSEEPVSLSTPTPTPTSAEPDASGGEQPLEIPDADADPETPEQDALVPGPATPVQKRKPAARKRASIPSWDEIMFGGPGRG